MRMYVRSFSRCLSLFLFLSHSLLSVSLPEWQADGLCGSHVLPVLMKMNSVSSLSLSLSSLFRSLSLYISLSLWLCLYLFLSCCCSLSLSFLLVLHSRKLWTSDLRKSTDTTKSTDTRRSAMERHSKSEQSPSTSTLKSEMGHFKLEISEFRVVSNAPLISLSLSLSLSLWMCLSASHSSTFLQAVWFYLIHVFQWHTLTLQIHTLSPWNTHTHTHTHNTAARNTLCK